MGRTEVTRFVQTVSRGQGDQIFTLDFTHNRSFDCLNLRANRSSSSNLGISLVFVHPCGTDIFNVACPARVL